MLSCFFLRNFNTLCYHLFSPLSKHILKVNEVKLSKMIDVTTEIKENTGNYFWDYRLILNTVLLLLLVAFSLHQSFFINKPKLNGNEIKYNITYKKCQIGIKTTILFINSIPAFRYPITFCRLNKDYSSIVNWNPTISVKLSAVTGIDTRSPAS